MPLRAICFDLDGLLVDSEPFYYEAHRSVFADHGVAISKDYYARQWIIAGSKTSEEAPKHGITADPAAMTEAAKTRFRALIADGLKPMPHALETLQRAAALGPTALVTNTGEEDARAIVERLGMRPYLTHLVTRERYDRAKPEPDAYLAAARVLGVRPEEALALEDSPRGMRAALAARMPCVLVLNELTRIAGRPRGPVLICESLAGVNFEDLARGWR